MTSISWRREVRDPWIERNYIEGGASGAPGEGLSQRDGRPWVIFTDRRGQCSIIPGQGVMLMWHPLQVFSHRLALFVHKSSLRTACSASPTTRQHAARNYAPYAPSFLGIRDQDCTVERCCPLATSSGA
jgi:hypothetical protein